MTLAFEMRDAQGKSVGRGTESLCLTLLSPLRLSAAPTEKGFRVTVGNPSGASFAGNLLAGDDQHPVSLARGLRETTVELTASRSGSESAPPVCQLTDKLGAVVAETPSSKFSPLLGAGYAAKLDGDAQVPATASIKETAAPSPGSPYASAFALDYQFNEGWRFVRCEADRAIALGSRPAALGVWVYGDNSANALRMRVRDASGQTFQPSGVILDWVGWRWITFDLLDLARAGHWGGANDGAVHGDLTLDTPLLVDSTRAKTSGRIYFAGLTVIR